VSAWEPADPKPLPPENLHEMLIQRKSLLQSLIRNVGAL
jgi:hypothetical protein